MAFAAFAAYRRSTLAITGDQGCYRAIAPGGHPAGGFPHRADLGRHISSRSADRVTTQGYMTLCDQMKAISYLLRLSRREA